MLKALDAKEGDYLSFDISENMEGKPQLILSKHKERFIELPNETINEIKKAIKENNLNQTVNEFVYDVVKEFITKQN